MKLVRHAWLLAFPAVAFACQLVDPESDLHEGATPGVDASMARDAGVDASLPIDAAADVATDAPSASLCTGVDADICEDFEESRLSDATWAGMECIPPTGNGNAMVRFYGHYLNTILPLGAGFSADCFLQSVAEPPATQWTLSFDLTSGFLTPTTGATTYLTIARLDFNYDSGVDGGLLYQSFRLLVGNDDVAQLVEVEQALGMPDAAQVPIADTTGQQFLVADVSQPSTCHIQMHVVLTGPQLSSAESTCPGPNGQVTVRTGINAGVHLFGSDGGSAVLFLGFDDPNVPVIYDSQLDYDNVILQPH